MSTSTIDMPDEASCLAAARPMPELLLVRVVGSRVERAARSGDKERSWEGEGIVGG